MEKRSGPTQVGVRKSSGFCVISSYFQLPISIAIQTARPMAHNGNIKGKPISLPLSGFSLYVFHSWVSLFTSSLLTNPLSPMGARSRWALSCSFVLGSGKSTCFEEFGIRRAWVDGESVCVWSCLKYAPDKFLYFWLIFKGFQLERKKKCQLPVLKFKRT